MNVYNDYKKRERFGFTLIELLVAIAIIGILASVGLGSYTSSQIKARDARRKADLGQIQKALEMYYNDKGKYPLSDEGKIVGCDGSPCNWGSPWEESSSGTVYMKQLPEDTRYGYCYQSDDGTDYKLYARLENTKDKDCLGGDCETFVTCNGEKIYNYGVASSNTTP